MKVQKFTIGEVAKVEELAGRAFDELIEDGSPKGLPLAALYYVCKKREDPKFKWQTVLDTDFEEVANYVQEVLGDEDEDPKEQNSESIS